MGICLLVGLVLGGGAALNHLLDEASHHDTPRVVTTKTEPPPKPPPKDTTPPKAPRFEIYPPDPPKPARPKAALPPQERRPSHLPKLAIIIDDVGEDLRMAQKFMKLDSAVTLSILPYGSFSRQIAREAHASGNLLILHLPMEPNEYPQVNPGKGALLVSMGPDELIRSLERNIAAVPHIQGVNNHMGSRMTTVSTQMYQIFSILKKYNLFFIDSRTTANSLCKPSARLLKLPFGERDVFLDHQVSPQAIDYQLKRLLAFARDKGAAIGIGHPHLETYQALKKALPRLKKKTRLVPVSDVVHVVGQPPKALAKG